MCEKINPDTLHNIIISFAHNQELQLFQDL